MDVNDPGPLPVALLARAGIARDRLREALTGAGMQLVLEEDPNTLQAAQFAVAAPVAVVIALEAAVEDALEQLQPLLAAPDLALVFDEAELVARRDGWDAQRWGRHLIAKLRGHQRVLPPAKEEDEMVPQPVLAVTAAPSTPAASVPMAQALADVDGGVALLDAPLPEPALATAPTDAWSVNDDVAVAAMARAALPAPAAEPASAPLMHDGLSMDALDAAVVEANRAHWNAVREGVIGAVVVLAGLGGPDALRRFLAALPAQLEVPVLVRMPLDGGRYDTLVAQMMRICPLPVQLAAVPAQVTAGVVHVLGDEVGVAMNRGVLWFHADRRGLQLSTLPATESAVILLSGADLEQIGPALDLAEAGGWVAGQVGEGCYDPAAPTAVVAAGMFAGEPQELAEAIGQRWALDDRETL